MLLKELKHLTKGKISQTINDMEEPRPETISELTDRLKGLIEANFSFVFVVGEISNYKRNQSGHHYFSLKDSGANISCTIWNSTRLNTELSDGMKVIASGYVSVYPPQGKYQIIINTIQPAGIGDLYQKFEELKQKLSQLGYFDEERKRAIPQLCLKVGVSTSPTGAAIRDIISTIHSRLPIVEIYFRPTMVQGEGSEYDIAKAIEELNNYELDAIIIGRGGGSIEDLWSYNTEVVANAILNSKIPIISAVGHETDFTIADFVADLRAPTPTGGAQYVTPRTLTDFSDYFDNNEVNLKNIILNKLKQYKESIEKIYQNNFRARFLDKLYYIQQQLTDFEEKFQNSIFQTIKLHRQHLQSQENLFNSLHPLLPMEKGFVYLRQNGKLITNDKFPKLNKEVEIIRKNDILKAKIIEINNKLL